MSPGFASQILADGPNPRQGNKTDNAHPPIHPTRYNNNLQVMHNYVCIIKYSYVILFSLLKVVHVHLVFGKIFITIFHIIISFFVYQISVHHFIIELQYNHVLTL